MPASWSCRQKTLRAVLWIAVLGIAVLCLATGSSVLCWMVGLRRADLPAAVDAAVSLVLFYVALSPRAVFAVVQPRPLSPPSAKY
jgi:hypothetical protein